MTKGKLLVNPKLAMLVTNRYSKLFKIDSTFKINLAKYIKINNIRITSREYNNQPDDRQIIASMVEEYYLI